jgi:drug/metabolite transporter (DMT)-like permease
MSRPLVWSLYGLLVVIWSSTWVAIKVGLEDTPPLLGAGVRFAVAGLGLLVIARMRGRSLRTDRLLAAILAAMPFAAAYGLIYWGEQYIPSGLTAVLFGVMPIYVALIAALVLEDEPLRARLLLGVGIALCGLIVAFSESLALGDAHLALAGAAACVAAPLASAVGNVSIKRRARGVDVLVLNGWGMLGGGALLLAVSATAENWGAAIWSAGALGSIAYLSILGSAFAFVTLTVLITELTSVTTSFIALLLPFGALAFGAAVHGEAITLPALGGAALVAAGLAVAQWPSAARRRTASAPGSLRPEVAQQHDAP